MSQTNFLFSKNNTHIQTFISNEDDILSDFDADNFYVGSPMHSAEKLSEHFSEIVFPYVDEFETEEHEQQREFLADVFSRHLEAIYNIGKGLEEEKEELEHSNTQWEEDFDDLNEENYGLKEEINNLETENEELKEEIQTLKNRVEELKEILYA